MMNMTDLIEYSISIEDDSKVDLVVSYLEDNHKDIGLLFNVVSWTSTIAEIPDDIVLLTEIHKLLE
jgi:hypothetical protein